MTAPHWKGYVLPGPRAPGRDDPGPSDIPEDQSLDALSGFFKIYQYRKGHRFSTDDLLVAWYGTTYGPSVSGILDLGSGIGTVAMVAAWRLPGARLVTVEAQEISIRLARKSIRFNGLEDRFEARLGDFRDSDVLGSDEKFDLVLGSPPYFPLENGPHGDHEQKIACRFEVRGNIADYCATASRHLAPGGNFACIFPVQPAHQERRMIDAAAEAGLTIVRRRDVILKEGEPPLLGLFLLARSADLPEAIRGRTWAESPLTIRRTDGSIHPEYSVIKMSIGFAP